MDVLVVRHGAALDRDVAASNGISDEHRPLTGKGRTRTRRVARVLANRGPTITALLTSPLLRATETAAIVGKKLRLEPEVTDVLLPSAKPAVLGGALRRKGDTVLVVGHEPHLSCFIGWAVTGEPRSIVALAKAGACLLRFDGAPGPRRATLVWLLTPALLEDT